MTTLENMQHAWKQALLEIINTSENAHESCEFIATLCAYIKRQGFMREAVDTKVINFIYDEIRVSSDKFNLIMDAAVVFKMELTHWLDSISLMCGAHEVFTKDTKIVDKVQVDRLAGVTYYNDLYTNNTWLLMLFFASTQHRITNQVIMESGVKEKPNK
jgi:hypothetical protein